MSQLYLRTTKAPFFYCTCCGFELKSINQSINLYLPGVARNSYNTDKRGRGKHNFIFLSGGYTYEVITELLAKVHGITMFVRTLKRVEEFELTESNGD